MSKPRFVHLHNHTEYSFLDGAIRINDMVQRAVQFGMPALAITDHGGMFGVVEFFNACMKAGIKPVIGFEAYLAPGSRFDRNKSSANEPYYHLLLLARNNEGYKNLLKLSSIGYLEGFYYKPRIDMEVLREHSAGLIGTSACVAGAIPQALVDGNPERARELAGQYLEIFGEGNFYFELQKHGIDDEEKAFPQLIELGREMGIPFIVANDAHYLDARDSRSHEVLLCIQTQAALDDPGRFRFNSDQIYFKSPDEMAALFPEIPEAMENTVDIAQRCNVDVNDKAQLPVAGHPEGFSTDAEYVGCLARKGLAARYAHVTPGMEERLEYELEVICKMGYEGYFLVVYDFVNAADQRSIMTGCRGSAAGSLVAYALGITHVDPIKYDLIFERFLNPERVSLPDADIDFADKDRGRIIEYVVNKYGRESVCQIINFARLKAKMVVKDVARVMGIAPAEAQRLSNMVTEKNLKSSIESNGELKRIIHNNPLYQELFGHAQVLEGLVRQAGMHAGGVIIAPGDVRQWAPLFKQSNTDIVMSQYDMNYVEQVGLVKMDFLGLRTLTVLQETIRLVERAHGRHIDLWRLPDNDAETLELFGRGETVGIFQFESQAMQDNLRKLKPGSIDDLIAMNALYRPGPMENIPVYIRRKHGKEKTAYLHSILEEILKVTYGVIVYQEQVMRIAQVMGGFTLGQADLLRRAMSKKDVGKMENMRRRFMEGAKAKGINLQVAQQVFDLIAKFAGYGFNKAHAAAYAHVAYQSAYLKAHYPLEFLTASLSSVLNNQDDLLIIKNEAERMNVRILPPDVNASEFDCSIENGSIRLGLGAIKNVGKAAESILAARKEKKKFENIYDLCMNIDLHLVNKKALESLVYAGALDSLHGTRAQLFAAIDKAVEYGTGFQKERASGQTNLFDEPDDSTSAVTISSPHPPLPDVPAWSYMELLSREKEVLNFFVSGHPLEPYRDEIHGFTSFPLDTKNLEELRSGQTIIVGGLITNLKKHVQKDGRPMAFAQIEDFDGSMELLVFGDAFEQFGHLLSNDGMVLVHGQANIRENETKPKLMVDKILNLSESRSKLARSVHLRMSTQGLEQDFINEIAGECNRNSGECALVIHLLTHENNEVNVVSRRYRVSAGPQTLSSLRQKLGKENVWLSRMAA